MMEKITEKRQLYKAVSSDDVVNKLKQILKDHFHSAATNASHGVGSWSKYMVTETYGSTLNINLNQQQTPPTTQREHQQRHMPIPPAPARVKTNVLTMQEKTCSCGRWQEFKFLCRHAMAYFRNLGRFSRYMHMTIIGTRACNRYMDATFSQ